MSSIAKSKKGFKKLETLEMVELNGSENCVVESDSETELLDLTTSMKGMRVRPEKGSTHYSCGRYDFENYSAGWTEHVC